MICYWSKYPPIGWQVGTGRFTPPYVILGGTRGIEMEIVLHMFMHGFMVMWMVCHWLMLSIFPASQPIQSCGATASIESKPVRLPMDWREGTGWVGTCWSSPISSFWCWNLQFWLSFEGTRAEKNPKGPVHASMRSHPSCQKAWQYQEVHVFSFVNTRIFTYIRKPYIILHIYIYNYMCIYIYIHIHIYNPLTCTNVSTHKCR